MDALTASVQQLALMKAPVQRVETSASRAASVVWHMLRLDLLDPGLSGNKLFKLLPFLQLASDQQKQTVLSFGGMHSNHLHALAVAGQRFGFATVGVVRGYPQQPETPTLRDLRAMGMQIHFADKQQYAQRYDLAFQQSLSRRYNNALVINEGGNDEPGIEGAAMMAQVLANSLQTMPDVLILAAGTGASFQGLLRSPLLPEKTQLMAVAALNNIPELERRTHGAGHRYYTIADGYQCGGFARINAELALFIHQFEKEQDIPLEPVYTGKMCLAIEHMMASGNIKPGSHIVSLHTGGLQGRRYLQEKMQNQTTQCHDRKRVKYA